MFKLLIALSLFLAIQGQLPGGFTDRPDLIDSDVTRNMVKLAINELANGQNLRVSQITIANVQSQVVNGVNYRIIFIARSFSSNMVVVCTTKIYQQFSGAQTVSSVSCA
jgi:hypothetical protein